MAEIISDTAEFLEPVEPPACLPGIQRGVWCALPQPDALADYLAAHHWEQPGASASWEIARLSGAVYLYREKATGWTAATKFYAAKTGTTAEQYALREFEFTQSARAAGFASGAMRAVRPLAVWRGVLLLEYVDGLTLEDVIAVRRSRPGVLFASLEKSARFLALLHSRTAQPDLPPDCEDALHKARKVVDNLAAHGVLQDDPIIVEGVKRQVERWAGKAVMRGFVPALTHGDTTTANFVFTSDGDIVIIDWERARLADPAADLGRLVAEISHSLKQHGGSVAEAVPDIAHVVEAYCRALPYDWDADALLERMRFYRAWSTLRIARNGWVSRLDRTALVAQALALLADEG